MLEIYVQFCGQRFLETGDVSGHGSNSIQQRESPRVANHIGFFPLSILRQEIFVQFCGQRFLEAGEVSGPGTNSIEFRGPARVANHMGFSFYR